MEIGERQKLYANAISKWGKEEQIWMVIEEIGELLTALNHFRRGRLAKPYELHEEIADLQIMAEQLGSVFGEQEVEVIKNEKLDRLRQRVADGGDVFYKKLNTKTQ